MIAMTNANFWAAIAIIIVGLIAMAVDVGRWMLACGRARLVRILPIDTVDADEADTTTMSMTLIDPREPPVRPLMHTLNVAGLDAHR